MSIMSNRKFILKVIEKYRNLPCLWQVTHPDYHNKLIRNRALDQLLEIFNKVDKFANRDSVSKKINSLRSSYRKESNKVKKSIKSGNDRIHVPKLWYYNLLTFLEGQELPRASVFEESDCDNEDDSSLASETQDIFIEASSSSRMTSIFKKPKLSNSEQVFDNFSNHVEQGQLQNDSRLQHDASGMDSRLQHDAFGMNVAEQLRSLPPHMVPICKKLISDVLYYAEIGTLDTTSQIVIGTHSNNVENVDIRIKQESL